MSEPEIESSSLIHISRQKSSSSSNHIFPPEKSSQFEAFSSDPLNATKVGGADWQIECSEQISLKVPKVDFDFDVCVDSILFLINTYIENLPSHLHAMIRTHHFDFVVYLRYQEGNLYSQ